MSMTLWGCSAFAVSSGLYCCLQKDMVQKKIGAYVRNAFFFTSCLPLPDAWERKRKEDVAYSRSLFSQVRGDIALHQQIIDAFRYTVLLLPFTCTGKEFSVYVSHIFPCLEGGGGTSRLMIDIMGNRSRIDEDGCSNVFRIFPYLQESVVRKESIEIVQISLYGIRQGQVEYLPESSQEMGELLGAALDAIQKKWGQASLVLGFSLGGIALAASMEHLQVIPSFFVLDRTFRSTQAVARKVLAGFGSVFMPLVRCGGWDISVEDKVKRFLDKNGGYLDKIVIISMEADPIFPRGIGLGFSDALRSLLPKRVLVFHKPSQHHIFEVHHNLLVDCLCAEDLLYPAPEESLFAPVEKHQTLLHVLMAAIR